jgi:hypothetical protein
MGVADHRREFVKVDCDGLVWRWDGHLPERLPTKQIDRSG